MTSARTSGSSARQPQRPHDAATWLPGCCGPSSSSRTRRTIRTTIPSPIRRLHGLLTCPPVRVQRTANHRVSSVSISSCPGTITSGPSLQDRSLPTTPGVGEVWIDTEYEKTAGKTKPGTATAVDATTWKVTKKVALPQINMNNPHNMWTDTGSDGHLPDPVVRQQADGL